MVVLVDPGLNSATVSDIPACVEEGITGTLTDRGEGVESRSPMVIDPADSLTVMLVSRKETEGGETRADSINSLGISKESGAFA